MQASEFLLRTILRVMRNVGAFDALISNLFGADYAVFYCLLNPENRIQKTHNPTGKEKQGTAPPKRRRAGMILCVSYFFAGTGGSEIYKKL